MEKPKFDINKYKTKTSKHKTPWQELCDEMTDWFKTNCFWLPFKYNIGIIKTEFGVFKQDGDHTIRNFIWRLKNKHMTPQDKEQEALEAVELVIKYINKKDKQGAARALNLNKYKLKDITYMALVTKIEKDPLKQAQIIFGGKITNKPTQLKIK